MGQKRFEDKTAAKKAAVLGKKKGVNPLLWMVVCAVLVIGGGVYFLGRQAESLPTAGLVAAGEAGEVTHPVSLFSDGKCRFFEHKAGDGLTIRYFVMKSSDGVIRSAFDACDSCWPAGKGYRQEGDEVVCQNCRMRFPSTKVMEVKGG